jgi:hypothetical protein
VQDVLLRYCRGPDRRDYALLRSCSHDDAYDRVPRVDYERIDGRKRFVMARSFTVKW